MRALRFDTVHSNAAGNLTVAAPPFVVRRVFWLHDVPGGAHRGGHAHHELQEVIIPVSGSFDVVTFNENGWQRWPLNRADGGLYIEPGVWRELSNFSSNAVALVLASTEYDEGDYIRDFERFQADLPKPAEDYFTRRARSEHLWEVER